MDIITIDLETFWDSDHTLSKMSPIAYCMSPRTEIISLAVKVNDYPTDVVFGEAAAKKALDSIHARIESGMVLGHNLSGFDSMILAWRLGVKPKMWGCTLAMARPIHTKTTGNSLAKLVEHYDLGRKDNAVLMQTKGRNLADFTQDERDAMRDYNRADVDQCYALFQKLKPHYTAKEMWHIDATIRMLVEPKFVVDTSLLDTALSVERDRKRKSILTLAQHLKKTDTESVAISLATSIEELEEAVRNELASAHKFSEILTSLGVEVPMKPSPTNPQRQVPALAKTDEDFIALQEHDNEVVAAAARARLAVKSTLLETRINAFLAAAQATGGRLPVPLNYCGADTTGRWSGWAYNPQNLPRIDPTKPKVSDAMRNCMRAPTGHKVVVADLSGIELRVNHFLWKVPSSMSLFQADPGKADLYKDFASRLYDVPVADVSKAQRQIGKIAHLGLGFGAGPKTFMRIAKLMGGVNLSDVEAADITYKWREEYSPIVEGWKTCGRSLLALESGIEQPVDPWGLCMTERHAIRLPSGRKIRYPLLRREDGGHWDDGRPKKSYVYGEGRHKAYLTGPKVDENIVQALARDVIADAAVAFFRVTKLRPSLSVHDELVYVVPEKDAQVSLDELQNIMRTPPAWWPALVTWSEGDVADTYGGAKG